MLREKLWESHQLKKDLTKESDIEDIVQKYCLDEYDEETFFENLDTEKNEDIEKNDSEDESAFPSSMNGISQFVSNKEDPYIQDDYDSDVENDIILPEDNMIALGKVDGNFCNLEFYCYNEKSDNLYCHHDILLPSFPLALAWLNYDPSENVPGNLVALGTMEPDIEIWDIDIMDSVAPVYVLEGTKTSKKKKKKKVSKKGHTDAVLDLDWNSLKGNILASASADFTIGLWDLSSCSLASSITHHEEKVQTLSWHPFESQFLASGSYDHTAKIVDCRAPDDSHKSWNLGGEVERVIWNIHDPFYMLASTDSGMVHCVDIRSSEIVFQWSSHKSATSGLSLSNSIPGCLITSGDKVVKVWDIRSNKPNLIMEKKLSIGDIGCTSASPDSGFIFAAGGEREMKILRINRNKSVRECFLSTDTVSTNESDIEDNVEVSAGNMDDEEESEALFLTES